MERRILVVDDDPSVQRLLGKYLGDAGYEVVQAANGREAISLLGRHGIKLVITDWMMPEMDGISLCRAIRSLESVSFVYVIVLTGHTDKERVVEALEAGADDFLSKPVHRQELLARLHAGVRILRLEEALANQNLLVHKANAEMALLNQKLEQIATTDELTGLANRREALARLGELWAQSRRYGQPLACVMIDIDHFKRCNDSYGHAAGDAVLNQVAHTLKRSVRTGEIACRVGGEEFLIICPNSTAAAAAQLAERVRQRAQDARVRYGGNELRVTISAGVAECSPGDSSPDALVKAADNALYNAKRSGRNRVCVADPERDAHLPDATRAPVAVS